MPPVAKKNSVRPASGRPRARRSPVTLTGEEIRESRPLLTRLLVKTRRAFLSRLRGLPSAALNAAVKMIGGVVLLRAPGLFERGRALLRTLHRAPRYKKLSRLLQSVTHLRRVIQQLPDSHKHRIVEGFRKFLSAIFDFYRRDAKEDGKTGQESLGSAPLAAAPAPATSARPQALE